MPQSIKLCKGNVQFHLITRSVTKVQNIGFVRQWIEYSITYAGKWIQKRFSPCHLCIKMMIIIKTWFTDANSRFKILDYIFQNGRLYCIYPGNSCLEVLDDSWLVSEVQRCKICWSGKLTECCTAWNSLITEKRLQFVDIGMRCANGYTVLLKKKKKQEQLSVFGICLLLLL